MCSKLVTHPVHYFMGNRSCVCHSTPPPSGKICNHYRFINITPRAAFVKAQVVVCLLQSTVLVLPASADIDLLRRIYMTAKESDKSQRNMCALQLLMLTCARPKNVRFAQWEEFRLERKVWLTPSKRKDKQADHVIPLSRQALELLDRIKKLNLAPEDSPYLFPAGNDNVLPDTVL